MQAEKDQLRTVPVAIGAMSEPSLLSGRSGAGCVQGGPLCVDQQAPTVTRCRALSSTYSDTVGKTNAVLFLSHTGGVF